MGEIDPPGLAGHVALPFGGVAQHRGSAILVKAGYAVALDVGPAGKVELSHRLHLRRQAMAIPAKAPFDPPAPHRLVAGYGVLHVPGQQVAVVGQAIGEGGAVVEYELLGCATRLYGRLKSAVLRPVGQDLALYLGKVGFIGHPGIGRRTAR